MHFSPLLNNLSGQPISEGWYGDVVTCLMPFASINTLNLANERPLPVTILQGSPCIWEYDPEFLKGFDCGYWLHNVNIHPLRMSTN